ncbi:MAG: hypothetical protein ABSG77_15250 [Candidatus Acidiferrum sp.]|jgi:hypothetical protein
MRRSLTGFLFVVCTLAIVMLGAATAWTQSMSQEKPTLYTYVSEWAVPRAMWADYQKTEASGIDSMNKLVADGTLVDFGSYSVLNHQEGRPTHGSWFSAYSMANLMKVLQGLRSSPDATGPVYCASKHWDFIYESRGYNGHSGTFKNGYLRVGRWKYKAGASDPDGKIMKATMVAVLEKLLADGALHGYQIDEETIHSSDPDAFYLAIVANGAEGIDKFNAALEESEKKNPAGMAGFESLLDTQGHRDTLAFVDTMTHK